MLRVGLYANAEVIAEGIAHGPAVLSAMQFGADPFNPVVAGFTENNHRGALLIGNHPFGSKLRVARMAATLAAVSRDESVAEDLRDKLRGADWQTLLEAILGVALGGGVALNGMGAHALVFSMMREEHVRANARAVEKCRFSGEEIALLRNRLLHTQTPPPAA